MPGYDGLSPGHMVAAEYKGRGRMMNLLAFLRENLPGDQGDAAPEAHLTAREARAQSLPALIAALGSEDSLEGVAAFREKRPPVWRGT